MATTKMMQVGLDMLKDVRDGEFDAAAPILTKLLSNIIANPTEPKYRTIKRSNAKIAALLATSGTRALLVGVGFVEAGDLLSLPEGSAVDAAEVAVAALAAQSREREASSDALKAADAAKRKERQDKESEERKRMQLGIMDDANARKEPGWKAKAAGVKDGRSIVGCGDVGIGKDSGG